MCTKSRSAQNYIKFFCVPKVNLPYKAEYCMEVAVDHGPSNLSANLLVCVQIFYPVPTNM